MGPYGERDYVKDISYMVKHMSKAEGKRET
jgi:hypothetical protein